MGETEGIEKMKGFARRQSLANLVTGLVLLEAKGKLAQVLLAIGARRRRVEAGEVLVARRRVLDLLERVQAAVRPLHDERVARAHGYTGDMHAVPLTLAKTIAKTDYWDKFQCDQFDPRIGYLVFDAAFNGGHPAQWLQAAAQVTQDGVVGTGTVAAVRGTDPWRIMARFNASHAEYYASLRNFTFIDGWVNRIAFNLRLGAENG